MLLDKKKAKALSEDKALELEAIGELDSIFSYINAKLAAAANASAEKALVIKGITGLGRATCDRLDLNDERRAEPFIQKSGQLWTLSGLHPPAEQVADKFES